MCEVPTGESSNPTDVSGSLFLALIICPFDLAAAQFITQPFQPECRQVISLEIRQPASSTQRAAAAAFSSFCLAWKLKKASREDSNKKPNPLKNIFEFHLYSPFLSSLINT